MARPHEARADFTRWRTHEGARRVWRRACTQGRADVWLVAALCHPIRRVFLL